MDFQPYFKHNYYLTENPDAIWNEADSEISPNPSLLFLAKDNQKIIDMDLVNCFDAIFFLVEETDENKLSYGSKFFR
jgi:hypothetical protein